MKRSEINRHLRRGIDFFSEHCFILPPFAHWTPKHWQTVGPEADEVRRSRLGWDITDFGSGSFEKVGLLLFTMRNGDLTDGKVYAEKIMICGPGQITPWHYHKVKTEDIINRGGGRIVIELQNTDPHGGYLDTPVSVACDGVRRTVEPGSSVVLEPGESITLTTGIAHQFFGDPDDEPVLLGEVSCVNDDATDNYFRKPLPRFPAIDEDEPPLRLLCSEYPPAR